jgi:hypothetical protein
MGRADALLRERETGDLYVLSFKTTAKWDQRIAKQGYHDMQGLSEVWLVSQRRQEPVVGTKMEYLVKGPRLDDIQRSPLVRAYVKRGATPEEDQYAWSYEYPCFEAHIKGKTKAGKPIWCDGYAKHRLGGEWQKCNIWEEPGGIKEWIRKLEAGEVQPDVGDCLEQQFVSPLEYQRDEQEIEDWQEQVVAQETSINGALEFYNKQGKRQDLNSFFPQHRASCDYPSACDFLPICDRKIHDPLGSGLYQIRKPHHEPEIQQLAA